MPRDHDELAGLIEGLRLSNPRIAEAYRAVDRARFVPPELRRNAYGDRPVPLPEGQTTSQPSLIAIMIAALDLQPDDRVLEVGTGYGYQTALLAHLAAEVVSIERRPRLAEAARDNLADFENVTVLVGDGWQGAPERAPFDGIIVAAAASEVPSAYREQLADGGRLVIPVASARGDDVLLFAREGDELASRGLVSPARFVPLVGP